MFEELCELVRDTEIHISEQEILNFIKIEKRWPFKYPNNQPSLEIINNCGNNQNEIFYNCYGYPDYNKWLHFYELGYTTIISNILDLNEDLRNLSAILEKKLGTKVWGNFYFSKPGQLPSFPPHKHTYNVIAKQIYGTSEWINGEQQLTLNPQDTIFIPANTVHQVIAKQDKKLSLTLNIE